MQPNKKLHSRTVELEFRHQKEENKKLEYKTLQNKISEIESHHHSALIFTFSAIGVISSFSIQQEEPVIMLANFFIILLSMQIFERLYREKKIISDHIMKHLEPEIVGLKFETERASSGEQKREYLFTKIGCIITLFCIPPYNWHLPLQYAKFFVFLIIMITGTLIIYQLENRLYRQRETDKKPKKKGQNWN